MNVSAVLLVLGLLLATGCQDARTQYAASLGTAPPVAPPPQAPRDDWITFAHDARRTGYQPQLLGLDAKSVTGLRPRWVAHLGEPIKASPLVVPGRVFIAGQHGTVRALDSGTGRTLWSTSLGGDIEMTPAFADGLLFVGVRAMPGILAALDVRTGAVKWRYRFPGGVRGEPVVYRGVVYEGETGGDFPSCGHGGVRALDERTGRLRWVWYVAPKVHQGGSVWAPLGFDGVHLIFGTGNGCVPGLGGADALIALDLSGRLRWSHEVAPSNSDDDFGGGTLLMHGQVIATNKDGNLYDLSAETGALEWSTPMGSAPGYGSIGTPTSNGAVILASAGFLNDPTKTKGPPGGALIAYDTAGHELWHVPTKNPFPGAAAIEGGLAFAALDDRFVALDLTNGSVAWSYSAHSSAYASPAVVPSGVYFADDAGAVFAFSNTRSVNRVSRNDRTRTRNASRVHLAITWLRSLHAPRASQRQRRLHHTTFS